MKRFLLPSILLAVSSSVAFEAHAGVANAKSPLLIKRSTSGFVPEEWKKVETCEVYADKILIKREFGIKNSIQSEELRQNVLKGEYQAVLEAAAAGKISQDSMPVIDTPSYEYLGYIQDGQKIKTVVLKSENGMNASLVSNTALEAQLLMNLLDSVCPQAFVQ